MSRVRLLDSDWSHALEITRALRAIPCEVSTCIDVATTIWLHTTQDAYVEVVTAIPQSGSELNENAIRHALLDLDEPHQVKFRVLLLVPKDCRIGIGGIR
jgi:hypothetical protein